MTLLHYVYPIFVRYGLELSRSSISKVKKRFEGQDFVLTCIFCKFAGLGNPSETVDEESICSHEKLHCL